MVADRRRLGSGGDGYRPTALPLPPVLPPVVASLAAAAHGQGWPQVRDLLIACGLTSLVGLERQLRGKPAGLRTTAIVGTSAALIVLVSKFGFTDVLAPKLVAVDPSRVAAQVVSGVGFIGGGLILTNRGRVRGLTTAASVWEAAAIGMAAGADLTLLAAVGTGLHFVTVLLYTPLDRVLPGSKSRTLRVVVTYEDGKGVLRGVLARCSEHGWEVSGMDRSAGGAGMKELFDEGGTDLVRVGLSLAGSGVGRAAAVLGDVEGVRDVRRDYPEDE